MFIISFCLAADASVLITNPSLYRKTLVFIHDSMGFVWSSLYSLLFSFCAIHVIVSIILSGMSILFILPALMMACLALYFFMIGTEKYGRFAVIWLSLSDIQYRIAGLLFVILAAIVCYITASIR